MKRTTMMTLSAAFVVATLLAGCIAAPQTPPVAANTAAASDEALPTQEATATTATTVAESAATAVAIACDGELTPAQTEGPYYTENPPERASLVEPGMSGTQLLLTGYVLDPDCTPIPGARVDVWQADAEGVYDNAGYNLRGFTVTDEAGRYSVETVVPGLYPGRTRHIHVKVQPPGGAELTTQVYFPDEPANQRDGIFSPKLILEIQQGDQGEVGAMNFIVAR